MTLDQYSLCPGGLGTKIKFCCKDLVTDLGKIFRAMEGEQYEAAVQLAQRALKMQPDRQCLHALHCQALMGAGRPKELREATLDLLRAAPENPVGLGMLACLEAEREVPEEDEEEHLRQLVRGLHQALGSCQGHVPAIVFEGLNAAANRLLLSGYPLAGREHLMLTMMMTRKATAEQVHKLRSLNHLSPVPLVLKDLLPPLPKPIDWVQWKEEYVAAYELGQRGGWSQAADQVRDLIERYESHPVLLQAHAALRCRLPDANAARQALVRLAESEAVSANESVEAYALAMALAPRFPEPSPSRIVAVYEVDDVEAVNELLCSTARLVPNSSWDVLPEDQGREDGPVAKTTCRLLDREPPAVWDDVTWEQLPRELGEVALFGRETDREARLQLAAMGHRLADVERQFLDLLGDRARGLRRVAEHVVGRFPHAAAVWNPVPYVAATAPYSVMAKVRARSLREILIETWPSLPHPELEGKPPREAAAEPAMRRKVLALLLNLESQHCDQAEPELFDELGQLLGLPDPEPIVVRGSGSQAPGSIRLVQLRHVDGCQLETPKLLELFRRACEYSARHAAVRLGKELIARDDLQKENRPLVLLGLADNVADAEETLQLLQAAETAAIKAGVSPADIMVYEFEMAVRLRHSERAEELLDRLQTQYLNQPGIADRLVHVLKSLGLLRPDGREPASHVDHPDSGVAAYEAPANTVWTPAESSAGGDKSTLWLPGME